MRIYTKAANTGKKPKILMIQGSPRSETTCPGQDGKTRTIVNETIYSLGNEIDFELFDLALEKGRPIVQPCKGCISTAGGFHCHWPCSCYKKGMEKNVDLIYEEGVYQKFSDCDAFIVYSPIHWYAPSSVVKMLFDRLVCCNLTLDQKTAMEIGVLGSDGFKMEDEAGKASLSKQNYKLLKNHLEGKVGGFYVHGDDGANDYQGKDYPKSFNKEKESKVNDPKQSILPIVEQCRYSGIVVPDDCIIGFYMNKGVPYFEANKKGFTKPIEISIDLVKRVVSNL
jgi:multimeric flavodoxin WrbA